MSDYLKLLGDARTNVRNKAQLAGVTENTIKAFIVNELTIGIERDDWYMQSALFEMACSINNPDIKSDILNTLLLTPGHTFHQEITRAIQDLGHPSSISCIDKILSDGFGLFEYTSSEDGVIAKWFSHALADIGTSEAIQIIRKFSHSPNTEIANEMKYRLERIRA
jgi:hypothetical protein